MCVDILHYATKIYTGHLVILLGQKNQGSYGEILKGNILECGHFKDCNRM